ncbi:hypothetical protein D7I39_11080 [Allopusillimonas ginsengisoli]|nr:hypothetical protein D7I39_11080 [Allopusillimonas ginsengisoli]
MDTQKFAMELNRRCDGMIIAVDEGSTACVFYLRDRRAVSIQLRDWNDDFDGALHTLALDE